jgi:hypothetical protein
VQVLLITDEPGAVSRSNRVGSREDCPSGQFVNRATRLLVRLKLFGFLTRTRVIGIN